MSRVIQSSLKIAYCVLVRMQGLDAQSHMLLSKLSYTFEHFPNMLTIMLRRLYPFLTALI